MAENSDGSVVIDTELDNSGFEKGSNKLLSAVKDLTGAVDVLGDNMMRSFSQVIPMLTSIATSAASTNAAMTQGATQNADANARLTAVEQQLALAAQQAAQATGQQGQEMNNLSSGAASARTSLSGLERQVNSISSGMSALSASAEKGFASGNAVFTFDQKLSDMSVKISDARQKLEEFGTTKIPTDDYVWLTNNLEKANEELNRLNERQIKMEDTGVKQNSKAWQSLAYDISLAKQKVSECKIEMSAMEANGSAFTLGSDTAEYQRMRSTINECGAALERNRSIINAEAIEQARLNVLAAQESVAAATTSRQREAAMEQLRAAQQELAKVSAEASRADTPKEESISGWKRFGTVLKTVGSAALKLTGTLAKITFGAIGNGIKAATNKMKQFVSQMRSANTASKGLVKQLTSLKTMMLSKIKAAFISQIWNGAKEGLLALAQFSSAFNVSMSNIKNAASELTANLTVLLGSFIQAIEPVLTTVINIISRAVAYLNALIATISGKSSVTVAKKQTASYVTSTDAAKKSAQAAQAAAKSKEQAEAKEAKTAEAAAKAKAKAADKAAKAQAKSDAKATKSATEAAEKEKELNSQVYGFDELNKRDAEDTNVDTPGISDDLDAPNALDALDEITDVTDKIDEMLDDLDDLGAGLQNTFETVNVKDLVPESLQSWFDRIKEAFQSGDWFGLGSTIAEGLNVAMGAADNWINNKLRPKAVMWTRNIATVLNGLVAGFDWGLLGKTIADGINAVFDVFNTFLTTFDFDKLGKGVGKAINGLFNNVDWKLLGKTFANRWNALIDFIFGLATTVDWSKIGESLSDFVDSFVSGLKLEKAVESVGILINGLFTSIGTFIDKTDWGALATKFANSINKIFTSIDFAKAIETVVKGFNTVVKTVADLIKNIDWYAIGKDLSDSLTSLITTIDWKALGELLSNAVLGLLDLVLSLIGKIDWGGLIQNILTGIGTLIETIDWGQLLQKIGVALTELIAQIPGIFVGKFIGVLNIIGSLFSMLGMDSVAGFFKGIGEKLKDVGSWLKENMVDPVVDAVKELFGIRSPSTVFAELGGFLIEGLLNGISTAWNGIKSFFSTAISNLKNTLSKGWNSIKSTASTSWNSIKSTISSVWDNMKSTVSSKMTSLSNSLSSAWGTLKSSANTWGRDLCQNMANGINSAVNAVGDAVRRVANQIKAFLGFSEPEDGPLSDFHTYMPDMLQLMAKGIKDNTGMAIGAVSDLATAMSDEINDTSPELTVAEDSTVAGLDAVASRLSGIAETFRAITAMLNSIGGFKAPQIAAGNVVPVKTRIDATQGASSASDSYIAELSNNVDERLADVSYLLKQLIAIVKALNLNIDIDALTEMITQQQRSTLRNFGGG